MSKAKDGLKNWAPKRGKKILGMPEWLGFFLVLVVLIIFFVALAR